MAKLAMSINALISRRWSPYAFNASKRVEAEKLALCFEAARWAPSSYNEQPWHIVYADKHTDPAAHARILSFMVEFNQSWAQYAPIVGLVARHSKSNVRDGINPHAEYDCGSAMAMLSVQATELGLHVHQMAGFDSQKADVETQLPEGYSTLTVFALGYVAENVDFLPQALKERHEKQRARVRKEVAQVAAPIKFK
jgi:nitroreductase